MAKKLAKKNAKKKIGEKLAKKLYKVGDIKAQIFQKNAGKIYQSEFWGVNC